MLLSDQQKMYSYEIRELFVAIVFWEKEFRKELLQQTIINASLDLLSYFLVNLTIAKLTALSKDVQAVLLFFAVW